MITKSTYSQMKPDVKYCQCMEQILDRIYLLIEIIDNGKTLGNESFDFEVIALNFRKILELIAYGSMVAHHDAYLEAYDKARSHHRAKDILECIERLNNDFYPKPVNQEVKSDSIHHLAPTDRDYLTREDFIVLYDKCSKVLHVQKVLVESHPVDFILSPKEWLNKITALLDGHMINLLGTEGFWFVRMKGPDGRPHAYTLGPRMPEIQS